MIVCSVTSQLSTNKFIYIFLLLRISLNSMFFSQLIFFLSDIFHIMKLSIILKNYNHFFFFFFALIPLNDQTRCFLPTSQHAFICKTACFPWFDCTSEISFNLCLNHSKIDRCCRIHCSWHDSKAAVITIIEKVVSLVIIVIRYQGKGGQWKIIARANLSRSN